MEDKNQNLVGKKFKSDLEEWKDSVIVVEQIFPRPDGIMTAGVREFFTEKKYYILKEKLESSLFFPVEQTKESVEKVRKFAVEKEDLRVEINKLKKVLGAISDICDIPGGKEFQKGIIDRIDKRSKTFESMKKNWEMKLFQSYKRVKK